MPITKARQLAELIANSLLDSDEISVGAVTTSKLADTLDLSSKTIVMPDLSGTLVVDGGNTNNTDDAAVFKGTGSEHIKLLLDTSSTGGHRASIALESNSNEVNIATTGSNEMRFSTATTSDALFIKNNGDVGIGTDSPSRTLDVRGSARFSVNTTTHETFVFTTQALDDAKLIMKNASSQDDIILRANGDSYFNGGNVGIGETSPNQPLVVKRATDGAVIVANTGQAGGQGIGFFTDTANNRVGVFNNSSSSLDMVFNTGGTATAGEAMRIDNSTKNVGIGESNPTSVLSISKNSTRTTDFENMLKITHTSSGTTGVGFGSAIYFVGERENGVNQAMGRLLFDAEVNSGTNISSGFSVQTATAGSTSEKFRITHDGHVGIGETSTAKLGNNLGTLLNVNNATIIGNATGGSYFGYNVRYNSTWLRQETSAVGIISLTNSGKLTYRTAVSGNAGTEPSLTEIIRTGDASSPAFVTFDGASQVRLTLGNEGTPGTNTANWIRGNAGYLQYNSASSGHTWEIAGTERMRIHNDGNVGIGTTAPSVSKGLHVRGGLHVEQQASDPNQASGGDSILKVSKLDNKDWTADFVGESGTATDYGMRVTTTTSAAYGIVLLAAGAYRFRVLGNGNVLNANNSYGAISDIKLKENIADATSQWNDIKAVRVRKYSFKSDQLDTPNQLGVIAQELESAGMNGLVTSTPDIDDDKNLTGTSTKEVKYSVLYMKAIKALQEAMTRIEQLEARLTAAGIE